MSTAEQNQAVTYEFAGVDEAIVAIDTSIGTSIAVGKAGKVTEISSDDPFAHTEVIGTLLAESLQIAGVAPEEVRYVVQGIGPGPFTGLRIGLVTAQTFALALNLPLLSVISHDGVALKALNESARDGASKDLKFRVIQDAKRRELFVSEYAGLDAEGLPVKVAGPAIETRADLEALNSDIWPERVSAASLIKLAITKLKHGKEFESSAALYLRQPDVNLNAAAKFGVIK